METKKDPQIIRRLALLAEGVVVAEVVGVGVRQQLPPVAEAERFRSKEGRLLVRVPEEGVVVRERAVPAGAVEGVGAEGAAGYRNTADRIQEELRLVAEEVEGAVAAAEEVAVELHNTEDQILGQMPARELRDRRRGRSTYR